MGCIVSVRITWQLATLATNFRILAPQHETAKIPFEIAKICLHYADK
jgi:hypothetical protein